MSATAFQRMRREDLAKKAEKQLPIDGLTIKQLREVLEEKGIEFDPKAKKEDLIKLLEGAE